MTTESREAQEQELVSVPCMTLSSANSVYPRSGYGTLESAKTSTPFHAHENARAEAVAQWELRERGSHHRTWNVSTELANIQDVPTPKVHSPGFFLLPLTAAPRFLFV